jgi:hypothetical protein
VLREDQPQAALVGDLGQDRDGDGQSDDRAAQAGVRAQ